MRHLLHILTRPGDALANEVIELQRAEPDIQLVVVDLTKPEPDYEELLQEIFSADSVQVW